MGKAFCSGVECPVRNTCLRYTLRDKAIHGEIRKCTNQKKYIQDISKINTSCLKKG